MVSRGQELDDRGRLDPLTGTGLLGRDPGTGFDRLVNLARRLLRAPVSLISLVDDHRQYVQSDSGLGALRETRLCQALCQRVARSGQPLVVVDATRDESEAGDLGEAGRDVAAYAGVPLVTAAGEVLGSLCVIDTATRAWTDDELAILGDLAASVMTEIELSEALRQTEVARARLALLADASTLLATLDSSKTPDALARLSVRGLADWCSVELVSADGGSVERVAVAHVDPAKERLAQRLLHEHADDPDALIGVRAVIRSGHARLVPVVDAELVDRTSHGDDYDSLLLELGLSSIMVVPLNARGRTLGAITFARGGTGTYDDDDLGVALDLARRAALALDNARAYEAQHEIARTLQRSLLPPALPDVRHFAVAATYKTAGDAVLVGGDFYDLFPLRGPGWGVAIGDVQGKGSRAAALTALARYTVRAGALTLRNPKQVLRTLNEAVLRESSDRFLTIALLTLQPSRDGLRARLCLAGHPKPFVVRATGEIEQMGRAGTLLGVVSNVELAVVTFELRPGDFIVLFTDGLLEARRDGEQFGNLGVREVLSSCVGLTPAQVISALEEAVTAFGRGEPRDDMAILVLGRPESDPEP